MKKFDYSGLIKAIGEIKTNETKALNEELFSQKQHLADLENKVTISGILKDWSDLKNTCREVGIRLFPLGSYNSVVDANEEKLERLMSQVCYFEDDGGFSKKCGVHNFKYGFTSKGEQIAWKWFIRGFSPITQLEFGSEMAEVKTKIFLLQTFLDTYEEYREVQLQRVFWAMGKLAEIVTEIRKRIDYSNANFIKDKEKMRDFKELSKKQFLSSYSYLTEQEYDNTAREMLKKLYERLKQIDDELGLEYEDGETCWAANLEAEYERTEELICKIESEMK